MCEKDDSLKGGEERMFIVCAFPEEDTTPTLIREFLAVLCSDGSVSSCRVRVQYREYQRPHPPEYNALCGPRLRSRQLQK